MFVVIAFACFGFLTGLVSGESDYTLEFPQQGVTDYAQILGMQNLAQFTVCFWIKTTVGVGAPFSYASSVSKDNDLLFFRPGNFRLFVGNDRVLTDVAANDGEWHQICATWRNSDGEWKFYKDGKMENTGQGLNAGYTIKAGGSLILGQEQDSVGGGFDASQSFQGKLSNVNVWSDVLAEYTIMEMAECCLDGAGDVYMWSDFRDTIQGNTSIMEPAGCPCDCPAA